jgi:hypothetical protein
MLAARQDAKLNGVDFRAVGDVDSFRHGMDRTGCLREKKFKK